MLTPAQQKVKQELEELKASGLLHHEDEETVPPALRHPMKKWAYTVSILVLLIIMYAGYMIGFSVPKQERISSFLAKEQEYNQQSAALLDDFLNKHPLNLEEAIGRQERLIGKVEDLPAPAGFKVHKQDLIRVFQQRHAIFTYLAHSKTADPMRLNKLLMELDVKEELVKDSLLNAFQHENIKHGIKGDGSVQYWINGEVYTFEN